LGQDLTEDGEGRFGITRGVAADRVVSTVDSQARHGHKTNTRGFDGYKSHLAADPDSEIITATAVTPGNSGDAEVAQTLLADILPSEAEARPAVYGDAAYGAGELVARLDNIGVYNGLKVRPPARIKGHYGKDSFTIDLDARTVTCPAGIVVGIRRRRTPGRRVRATELDAADRVLAAGIQLPRVDHEPLVAARRAVALAEQHLTTPSSRPGLRLLGFEVSFQIRDVGRHFLLCLTAHDQRDQYPADAVPLEVDGDGQPGPGLGQRCHREIDGGTDGPVNTAHPPRPRRVDMGQF
jgi:hypothetical protein